MLINQVLVDSVLRTNYLTIILTFKDILPMQNNHHLETAAVAQLKSRGKSRGINWLLSEGEGTC
jgi:hypothetical protein